MNYENEINFAPLAPGQVGGAHALRNNNFSQMTGNQELDAQFTQKIDLN